MTKHKKLLPVNSKISTGLVTDKKYHVIKSYHSYAVVDGKWSVLETSVNKHLLGDCKHCKEMLQYLNEQHMEEND